MNDGGFIGIGGAYIVAAILVGMIFFGVGVIVHSIVGYFKKRRLDRKVKIEIERVTRWKEEHGNE